MRTTIHRTTIVGKCPHGCPDIYAAEFHVGGNLVTVERIQDAIDHYTSEPIYQEDLTQRLADALACSVVTVGAHGRFETTCNAMPKT